MGRERFSSRLGFILISAGCAIGLGNVWRFPYIVGQYGGAAFVLIYAAFLVLLGLPIIVMEYSVGRASQKSAALSFDVLEPKGTKWHFEKWFAMAGNYVLMMFYTTVAGWLLLYVFKMAKGDFVGLDADGVAGEFGSVLANPGLMTVFMLLCVVFCFSICAMGLQNGVEKITKMMMVCLLFLMVVLAINSVRMEGGRPGLEFYLKPDFGKIQPEDSEIQEDSRIPVITEPVLVMRDFTSRRIDALLLNLRKAKVPKINLKAIVTEQNAGWSFYHLYEEIGEEHRLMNGGAQ